MHKEHIVNIQAGTVAFRDTHTIAGRQAYIPEYREMGHAKWKTIYKPVYTGRHFMHSTKEEELKKYGLLSEHYELMTITLKTEVERLRDSLKRLENDLSLVSDCSQWLIEDRICEVQSELKSSLFSLAKYEKGTP